MITLGVDVSTKIIGFCVASKRKIEYIYIWNLYPYSSLQEKFNFIDTQLEELYNECKNVECINIEEYSLQHRKTRIETLVNLACINEYMTYKLNKLFNIKSNKINVRTGRKKVCGVIPKNVDGKYYVSQIILREYPSIKDDVENLIKNKHPEMLVTRGNNKGEILSIYSDTWMDVTDATVMGLYE